MNDQDWNLLMRRIESKKCTPFLGAGASTCALPAGSEIAARWAELESFPLEDVNDLAQVAQFLHIHHDDALHPKELLCEIVNEVGSPDFANSAAPHGPLAQMPFPLVMTTNYDNFMFDAFQVYGKAPTIELCRWNSRIRHLAGPFADPEFEASEANPVVYHLHGHCNQPESIVLTEDDYLDFLVTASRDQNLLPHQIQRALAGSSLLFIGYRLKDWDFRVLHRGLVMAVEQGLRMLSVTVQLPRTVEAQEYLDKYFGAMRVRVYWGTAEQFVQELWQRWQAHLSNLRGRPAS